MPKTATSPKDPPQPSANDRAADADSAPKPAPPPGMGKFVDKTV